MPITASQTKKISLLAVLAFFSCISLVFAHQPAVVGDSGITISDPETSMAYYGELSGKPATYTIESNKPFHLYANLLVPDIEGVGADKSAEILKDGTIIAVLDGTDYLWLNFYEPFADDYYLKGPELDYEAEAGIYTVNVYSADNAGKYVLAVGKNERFTLADIVKTLAILPGLKRDFFGRSPWTAYNNYTGLGVLIMLVFLAILLYFAAKMGKRWQMKKMLDAEYEKHRI